MTLQYRWRSTFEDERWRHRVYLCENLLAEAIDFWCRSEEEFPTRAVVAEILFLFSPRCEPYALSLYRLREQLESLVGTPEDEYRLSRCHREESKGDALIASLSAIITTTLDRWAERGTGSLSTTELAQRIAKEIMTQRYVVFRHCETTKRDK